VVNDHARGHLWALALLASAGACVARTAPPPRTANTSTAAAPAGGAERLECGGDSDVSGPSLVSHDAYASRTGVMATQFSQLGTSKERPLEECGLRTVLRRLLALTCDDGSNPFRRDMRAAHASRRGNVGPGGRCDRIIDEYAVACPERTYDVFADMYFCTKGVESQFMQ
jgi:hypothetical protein